MAILTLRADQIADLSVTIKDQYGNIANIESPAWESLEPDVIELIADEANPLKVTVYPAGPTDASSQIKFTADADLGVGVVPIIGLQDVVVTAGQAVVVEMNASAPRPKE